MPTLRLKITGKVQGVYYRTTCREIADQLKIVGYAKNLPDGSVEVVMTGPKDSLRKLCDWCQRGSERAKVEKVRETQIEPKLGFTNFEAY